MKGDFRLVDLIWFEDCDVLPGVFFVQVTAPLSPAVQSAAQVGYFLEAFRFQIIRDRHRKPAARAVHQNIFIARELFQVIFDTDRVDLMRIRQTFELSTIVTWAHIEDESFFIEENIFIQLRRREHVDERDSTLHVISNHPRCVSNIAG